MRYDHLMSYLLLFSAAATVAPKSAWLVAAASFAASETAAAAAAAAAKSRSVSKPSVQAVKAVVEQATPPQPEKIQQASSVCQRMLKQVLPMQTATHL